MADFHKIHSKIWTDSWFYALDHKHQLFFIYLFSNSRANIAGIYELPMPVMAAESKLTPDEINEAFAVFEDADKAFYEDGVVWVKNLRTYHQTNSPQLQKGIQKEIADIHDCQLKRSYIAYYSEDDDGSDDDDDTPSAEQNDGIDRVSGRSADRPSLVLSTSKSKSKSSRARENPDVPGEGAVFRRYENEIGQLTPMISEKIGDAIDEYGAPWVLDAIGIAVENNKRKLSYVLGILENWRVEGRGSHASRNGNAAEAWQMVQSAFNSGKYGKLKENPKIKSAIEQAGYSLGTLKDLRSSEIPFLQNKFMKAYNG